jgi:hypothetical protein
MSGPDDQLAAAVLFAATQLQSCVESYRHLVAPENNGFINALASDENWGNPSATVGGLPVGTHVSW